MVKWNPPYKGNNTTVCSFGCIKGFDEGIFGCTQVWSYLVWEKNERISEKKCLFMYKDPLVKWKHANRKIQPINGHIIEQKRGQIYPQRKMDTLIRQIIVAKEKLALKTHKLAL